MSSEQTTKSPSNLVVLGSSAANGGDGLSEASCCCGPTRIIKVIQHPLCVCQPWIAGTLEASLRTVPVAKTKLQLRDVLGGWKVRWGIGRMRYQIAPGLYAVGQPNRESPVLVSANYKLSFDCLRKQLGGLHAWILVIDTKGINVWCAAGKGTFGTDEIAGRVNANRLDEIVSHRTLIVPQLGAPGVAAHRAKELCGFRVVYGPTRAKDLPAFMAAGMKATPEMREVDFNLLERIAVIPVELMHWAKWAFLVAACLLMLSGINKGGYSWNKVSSTGLLAGLVFLGTWLAGTVLSPILLPWLPGRAFSLKGLWLGVWLLFGLLAFCPILRENWLSVIGWGLLIPTTTSFVTMGFTGSSTYTSLSGVRREMRRAVPLQLIGIVGGIAAWLAGRFI